MSTCTNGVIKTESKNPFGIIELVEDVLKRDFKAFVGKSSISSGGCVVITFTTDKKKPVRQEL